MTATNFPIAKRWMTVIGLSFVLCHLSFTEMQAKVRFGLKGGLELTQMEFSSSALKESNRAGFYFGPEMKFQLPVVGLGIDVSLLYNRRDLKVEDEKLMQQSLLAPAHLRYGVNIGDVIGIFLCAGPQFSFNVGDDVFYWRDSEDNNKQYSLQNTQLSLNFGGGLTLGTNLEASVFYNVPLGKTADFTWETLSSELKNQDWSRAKSRLNAWHISLTYYF